MTEIQDPRPPDAPEAPPAPAASGMTRLATSVSSSGVGVDPDGEGVPHAGLRLAGLVAALVALGLWRPWVLVVVLAIVVMITLHEFGHFIMAKRAGMKVTEFFLFFGPKVWSIKRGETEYGIKCIPAGAYVKIIGMVNLDEVPPEDEGRTYRQKTFAQRVKVAVAGSAMHFLLALVLIFVALSITGQSGGSVDPRVQEKHWVVGSIAPGTGAEQAGLRPDDRIVAIDGTPTPRFSDLRKVAEPLKGQTVPVTFERDGREQTVAVALKPFYSWFIDRVVPGTSVAAAGLAPDDQILAIDGKPTRTIRNLGPTLERLEGTTVDLTYERFEDETVHTAPVKVQSLILRGTEGYVGIGASFPDPERLNPIRGALQAPVDFFNITRLSVESLGKFFTPGGISDFAGQVGNAREDSKASNPTSDESSATLSEGGSASVSPNRLMSIYGLVMLGSDVGKVDPAALINLFALINIFIGVFNLVPLLPFDGGHVLIAVYEKIQEKRLHRERYFTDAARLLPLTYVVVVALGLLFVSTIYLDIANPLQT